MQNCQNGSGSHYLVLMELCDEQKISRDSAEAFAKPTNRDGKEMQYPQVRMVCQMELSIHLITGSAFDCN